jgi:hypothetical protein
LGKGEDDREITLSPCQDSVLVTGPDDVARAMICNRLLEQLMQQDYQCCVIGADRNVPVASPRGAFANMSSWGDAHEAPRLTDVLAALEPPTHSIEINLAALPPETRPVFVDALLLQLQALHDRAGRPHCILIHHAQHFLTGSQAASAIRRLSEVTMIYSTAAANQLPAGVVEDVKLTIATGMALSDAPEVTGASSSTQAVIAGGVCRISLLRSSAGATSVTSTDEATVSGY